MLISNINHHTSGPASEPPNEFNPDGNASEPEPCEQQTPSPRNDDDKRHQIIRHIPVFVDQITDIGDKVTVGPHGPHDQAPIAHNDHITPQIPK